MMSDLTIHRFGAGLVVQHRTTGIAYVVTNEAWEMLTTRAERDDLQRAAIITVEREVAQYEALRKQRDGALGWLESDFAHPVVMSPPDLIKYLEYKLSEAIKMLRAT